MNNSDFIKFLECEFLQYQKLTDHSERQEKKQFINGLMTASRFFGVSYHELNAVVDVYRKENMQRDDYLDIPTFIRLAK